MFEQFNDTSLISFTSSINGEEKWKIIVSVGAS